MYEFIVERRQPASVSSKGWEHVYSDNEESKARARYIKSAGILGPGWRIRLRRGAQILEDKTILESAGLPAKASSVGCIPSADDPDVDDIWVDADWMSVG